MLQKRIKLPSKKIISSNNPQQSKKKDFKKIPKNDSFKKNPILNPNLIINEIENNNQKNSTITTDSNATIDTMKRLYIYQKNLSKQKNIMLKKTSKKNISRVISHENINSQNKPKRFSTIECKDINDDIDDMDDLENNNLSSNENDNDLLMDIDLQSLHMKSIGFEQEENENFRKKIEEFINNIKDNQNIIYSIRFINEIFFSNNLSQEDVEKNL